MRRRWRNSWGQSPGLLAQRRRLAGRTVRIPRLPISTSPTYWETRDGRRRQSPPLKRIPLEVHRRPISNRFLARTATSEPRGQGSCHLPAAGRHRRYVRLADDRGQLPAMSPDLSVQNYPDDKMCPARQAAQINVRFTGPRWHDSHGPRCRHTTRRKQQVERTLPIHKSFRSNSSRRNRVSCTMSAGVATTTMTARPNSWPHGQEKNNAVRRCRGQTARRVKWCSTPPRQWPTW